MMSQQIGGHAYSNGPSAPLRTSMSCIERCQSKGEGKKRDLEKIPSSLLIAGVVCLGVQLTTGSMYARMSQRINELCIYIYPQSR